MIAKFAKKINEILIQKGIVQKEDAELYRYGIENGIVVAGKLLASGIFGYLIRHTFYFDDYTTRSNREYESLGITFTFTHTYIGRLLSNRFIGEYTDPNLTLTLHVTSYSNTSGLDLTTCNPFSI